MSVIRKISNGKPQLTDEQIIRLQALAQMSDDDIDVSDIAEITDWSNAKRGLFPSLENTLDKDVLDWLVVQDDNTKDCINTVIRQFMAMQNQAYQIL